MAQPATADSPQIVISYHVDDEKWANRVVTHLDLTAEKFGVLDDLIEAGADPTERLETLEDARVLIVLISRKYLASSWLTSLPSAVPLSHLSPRGLHVVGVLLQQLSTNELDILRMRQLFPIDTTAIAEASIEQQNAVLARLAREVTKILEESSLDQAPLFYSTDDLLRFSKSVEVENALIRARQLSAAGFGIPGSVTTPALLFGLAEGGRTKVDYIRTPQFLWQELTARGEEVYKKVLTEEFPALIKLGELPGYNIDYSPREAEFISPNVLNVFDLAQEISRRTVPQTVKGQKVKAFRQAKPQIGARHLLAALLVLDTDDGPTGASRRLATIVGDVAALRKRFYNFIVKNLPDDDHEAWRPILINLKLPEIQPQPPEQAESPRKESLPQPTVAGFMADDWQGRDLLGIERDVNALASLVAAYNVEPPLSIGLFGDWGSGKSHFMRQMRKRVELLSKRSRDSGKPQNELGYYKNIVQIEFNAWHYIEGNLWASLVDHIFANLRLSEDEPRTFAEQRRDDLIQKLGVKEEIQDKINSKVHECEDELRKLNERKERAEAELQEASTQLKGFREEVKANLKTLSVPLTFTEEEKELLGRLGIQTGTALNATDVHRNYLQLKGRWNSLKAKWKLFRSDKRVLRRYLLSALLLIILIGAPALLKLSEIPRLPTVVVSLLGFIATFLAAAKPAWDQFQKSLHALEKHDLELERERQKRITELESEVSALTKEVVAAKLEGETVGKEIEKLKADIETTNTSRILAEFIEDRAAATDYRRHLGLLALIRRDFEKLRDLFQEQRKEASEGKDGSEDPKVLVKRIDRIVLYIDDLDRCPPDRVVQVLQAIHLLLAFPLFVVVVGVDSRWITRSLQQSYEWLQEASEIVADNGTEQREETPLAAAGATPHDYLEKIFQIPFWLRPMNYDACIEFLDGLTTDATDNQAPTPEHKKQVVVEKHLEQYKRVIEQFDEAQVQVIDKPFDLATNDPVKDSPLEIRSGKARLAHSDEELAPRSLTFSSYEVDYMKKLVPLIGRSPRAVKRFLNCYRLIKVGLAPAEFENFVGENGEALPYKAAMILLGVITGTPAVSAHVIEQLKAWRNEFNFESFSGALLPNGEMRQTADGERLFRFLDSHDFGTPGTLLFEEMRNCASRISRFSFRVNRSDLSR